MYQKAYGIIETLAPLHVGASAGEETGNLNLIFRDQFTQTGIIPGSSIRGRFRADMRLNDSDSAQVCYGHEAVTGVPDSTTEALVKFEYASLVWLPVFCPGQPIVWITCPRLLRRYKQITGITDNVPQPYQVQLQTPRNVLFFNLGFLRNLTSVTTLRNWIPVNHQLRQEPMSLVIVSDNDIGIIHEMALYRQSRVRLQDDQKLVDGTGFFNTEALPEGSILVFPIAVKQNRWASNLQQSGWQVNQNNNLNFYSNELYFGGLESIGFGRCQVTLAGQYFNQEEN